MKIIIGLAIAAIIFVIGMIIVISVHHINSGTID